MRDFFERQDHARSKTRLLVVLFSLAVASIILCVYAAASLAIQASVATNTRQYGLVLPPFWSAGRFAVVSLITLTVISIASIYKIKQLGGGGKSVALMLGGRPIAPNTTDADERRLMNVVEEMAIASGVPVPDVYVMDRESAINAFAAGFGVDDAVVCVTRGTLLTLTRDELQGVVAHEFSHILNADTLINIRLMGLLHGILVIALAGEGLLRGMRFSRGKGAGGAMMVGIALYIIGYVGLFFGNIIKSAVSRQREYLADASAVQFTRNPGGISGALKKIGGQSQGSILITPAASQASHMFINDAIGGSIFGLMDTHPPLVDRIRRIEPRFDGAFPQVKPLIIEEPVSAIRARTPVELPQAAVSAIAIAGILESVGAPMQQHSERAHSIIEGMPEELKAASREPSSACAVIYMLLLDKDPRVREQQLNLLDRETSELTAMLFSHKRSLSRLARLPLVDLCLPSLRRISLAQYSAFKKTAHKLIAADNKLSLFEYTITSIVIRNLDSFFYKPKKKIAQIYSIKGVLEESTLVLSLISRLGHRSEQDAERAFALGRAVLGFDVEISPLNACTLGSLDKALHALNLATAKIKKQVLAACLKAITYDGELEVKEVEIFRAIADSLGCPVPPWMSNGAA